MEYHTCLLLSTNNTRYQCYRLIISNNHFLHILGHIPFPGDPWTNSCFEVVLYFFKEPQLSKSPSALKWAIKSSWNVFDFSYIDVKKIFNQNRKIKIYTLDSVQQLELKLRLRLSMEMVSKILWPASN